MKKNIESILEKFPMYQEALFRRGYLITSEKIEETDCYPFYGNWGKAKFGVLNNGKELNIYYHRLQDYFSYEENGISISIIGHAYNPFNMKYQEEEILKDLIHAYRTSEKAFFEKVSELTGIHLIVLNDEMRMIAVQDCSGMKSCYFGEINGDIYITSHPQLVGDICNLDTDPFFNKLTNAWFYRKSSQYLPGNLSPFREMKRLGPNTYLDYNMDFNINRFYPLANHVELESEQYNDVVETIGSLIHNNIELCSKKWSNVAISLSGGMDSKTTLACTNGLYDKFKYYSFYCKPSEIADAEAASQICDNIDLKHTIYEIPDNNEEIEDFEVFKKIICHNASYIEVPGDHEIRKFAYLYRVNDFDVELKSWISETGRATWERRHGVELPKRLTPRILSIFQTRYLAAPKLLKKSEQRYEEFLEDTGISNPLFNYEHSDLLYWELRWGSWGANVVTVQDVFSSKVTMPMNNRKLMDMFLWFPHEYRKNDMVHREVIKLSNEKITEMDLVIHNPYLSNRRQTIEQMYYKYRTLFSKVYI